MRTSQDFDALQVEQRPTAGNGRVQIDVIGVDPHGENRCSAGIPGAETTDVPTWPAITVRVLRGGIGHECRDVTHVAHAVGDKAGALYRGHRHRNLLQGFFPVLSSDRHGLE
ncbi:hypothetical protein D3C76_1425010 [compost metagenome]